MYRSARSRAILAKRYPCVCRGLGCDACAGRGHLTDRRTYAQLAPSGGPLRPAGSVSPADQVRALTVARRGAP